MKKKSFFTVITSLIVIVNTIIFTNFQISDWKKQHAFIQNAQLIVNKPKNDTMALDAEAVATYAHKSAAIPQALLLSKAKNVNTNKMFNHLNKMNDSGYDNFKAYENMVEYFIKKQTVALDDNSYQTIIDHSVNNDNNYEKINSLEAENKMLQQLNNYLNSAKNELVKPSWSITDDHIDFATGIVTFLRPDTTYLPIISYPPYLPVLIKYLITDWKLELQGNRQELREIQQQKGWSDTDIYLYDAGLNFNKALEKISGKDLGTLISENFNYDRNTDENKLDQTNLAATLATDFKKLAVDPEAGLLLLKGLVPLIKSKILTMQDPTVGIKKLSWLATDNSDTVALMPMLDKIFNLFQPENKKDLQTLLVAFLKSPFAATIKIKTTLTVPKKYSKYITSSYITYELNDSIPELINKIENASFSILFWTMTTEEKILYAMKFFKMLEKYFYPELTDAIAGISTSASFKNLKQQVTTYGGTIAGDSTIDLVTLQQELKKVFTDDLKTVVTNFVNAYVDKNSPISIAEIVKKLGLQLNTIGFLPNSPLAQLQALLKNEQTTVSKILALINTVLSTKIKNNSGEINRYYDNYISPEEVMSFRVEEPTAIVKATKNEASVIHLSYNLIAITRNIKTQEISKITKYHVIFKNKSLIDQTFLLHRLQLLS